MVGVMCHDEYLTGDLCDGIYSYEEYEKSF